MITDVHKCDACGISHDTTDSLMDIRNTGIRVCKDTILCTTYAYLQRRNSDMTEGPIKADPNQYTNKAKQLVADTVNQLSIDSGGVADLARDDFYIVWFAKVLGNWKALVSTDVFDGHYYEVTYNGAKQESYVDTYVKSDNRVAPDADYEEAQALRHL